MYHFGTHSQSCFTSFFFALVYAWKEVTLNCDMKCKIIGSKVTWQLMTRMHPGSFHDTLLLQPICKWDWEIITNPRWIAWGILINPKIRTTYIQHMTKFIMRWVLMNFSEKFNFTSLELTLYGDVDTYSASNSIQFHTTWLFMQLT